MRGLSEENGSWNTIWMSRRRSRSAASLVSVMSLPCSRMRPSSGFSRRITVLPTVVLPQPLSPTTPSVSPALMVKLTPSTA